MELFGIVAEFNPFHNGHKRLIDALKDKHPDAVVAVIMSGAFSQRGEVCLYDKWTRAKFALLCGCDLVFELPQVYATASLQYFAQGAIKSLLATGELKGLAFGSETGDATNLRKFSGFLRDEPKAYREALRDILKRGRSYGEAQYEALTQFFTNVPDKEAPNDRLAMQYLSHLPKGMSIFALRRQVFHQSEYALVHEAPASYIRGALLSGKSCRPYGPEEIYTIYQEQRGQWKFPHMRQYYKILESQLLGVSANELAVRLGLSDGFENRMKEVLNDARDYEEFLDFAQTRQYTKARISRLLLRLLSDHTLEETSEVSYLRLLGVSSLGKMALRQLERSSQVPIINSVAKSYPILSPLGQKMLNLDIRRQDLQYLFQDRRNYPYGSDYRNPPIVL